MLIPKIRGINFYNPIVKKWDTTAQNIEIEKRNTCDWLLYVFTPTLNDYSYSIAEVVNDSNKVPKKTIFCIFEDNNESFTERQLKCLKLIEKMIDDNGAYVLNSLDEVSDFLNKKIELG